MSDSQKTIRKEVILKGVGLHTGSKTTVRLKPAEPNTGIRFVRVDLPGCPVIKAELSSLLPAGVPRCTSIGTDGAAIHTVEHLTSVLCCLGVNNLIVEIDGNELPGLDGSANDYLKAVKDAGLVDQNEPRNLFEIREPVWVENGDASILIVPAADLKISYTLHYEKTAFNSQFLSLNVTPENFEREIAPSRTFCLEREAEELRKQGLGKGANYDNTLVITKDGGVKNNTLRFENEFVRHKVLDLLGDLFLLGFPIHGHIFAQKSGHTLNIALLKKIIEQKKKYDSSKALREPAAVSAPEVKGVPSSGGELDIHQIMNILPHRYPFLFVDRVVSFEPGKRAVGVKNVTINDNFFQGHFPARPIMPGVLMVEAMAQVGGIAVLTGEQHKGQLAFFLSTDKVKFRKVVSPGDQLVIEAEVVRDKSRTAQIRAWAKVGEDVVSEAEIMISFVDESYLKDKPA
ncbi:MAG TPA: UDP-3-O-acyl-N-acetylglucosamine deacetylase [Candidatus Omnitrophota bacterium]|nr:UDP-3-O-acyl-N-acetylglucosamine deacetylase [Candidatus Omnitrophota bacterium]HPD84301.1 UDP-3-O-acyl-N-acetylglucosamine deacetylase [Candidatus Omnitrophota bacterium]HRZ03158.1 UDP-3-O-acyl-N-acetylglucosamine deacetylase [Candidatus Omnitrophota bacterium]